MAMKSLFEHKLCGDVACPERIDCCTTVRWRISAHDYHDKKFREWWMLHEGARMVEEDEVYYIQWPMRCRNVSADGLSCLDYENRPDTCRMYVCAHMAEGGDSPE